MTVANIDAAFAGLLAVVSILAAAGSAFALLRAVDRLRLRHAARALAVRPLPMIGGRP